MILDLEGRGKREEERWGEVFETIRTQEGPGGAVTPVCYLGDLVAVELPLDFGI